MYVKRKKINSLLFVPDSLLSACRWKLKGYGRAVSFSGNKTRCSYIELEISQLCANFCQKIVSLQATFVAKNRFGIIVFVLNVRKWHHCLETLSRFCFPEATNDDVSQLHSLEVDKMDPGQGEGDVQGPTHRQTDRKTERQMDKTKDRRIDRQKERKTKRERERQTDRQADRQKER